MKTTNLIIVFNRFYSKYAVQYFEEVCDSELESVDLRELARKPKAARFDAVFETGEGGYNAWNAHRRARIYGHPLQRD